MSNFEKSEHNKKFIMRYALIHHEGVTEEDIRAFTDNETYIHSVMTFRRAFPDYMIHIEDITAEGDFVISHGIFRGTHKGEFHGIPATFRKVEHPAMIKYQVIDDKIVNAWPMFDQLTFLNSLVLYTDPDHNVDERNESHDVRLLLKELSLKITRMEDIFRAG